MLFHKMSSSTMKRNKNCSGCHQSNSIRFLLLSIIWTILFTKTMARPNLETILSNKPNELVEQQQDIFLDEMITNKYNGDKLFNKLRKQHRNQATNNLNKWPGLLDLILTFDYDESNGQKDSNEFWNTKFFDRLRQFASLKTDSYENDDNMLDNRFDISSNMLPIKSLKSSSLSSANQLSFKDHNIKKNVHYMSPCHFKICNMGRKRNARFFTNY